MFCIANLVELHSFKNFVNFAPLRYLEGDSYPTLSLVQGMSYAIGSSILFSITDSRLVDALVAIKTDDESNRFHSETIQQCLDVLINGIRSRIQFAPIAEYEDYVPVD